MPTPLMEIRTLKNQLVSIAAVAILAVPSVAAARGPVPPGNSAVNQYTETLPTAGGAVATKKRGKRQGRSPVEVLGSRNVRRLSAQGAAGREVAAVAAATAPSAIGSERPPRPSSEPSRGAPGEGPSGSSGFREVIAQATGSSDSGRMGVLLPLLIVGAIVCSAFYFWRQRQRAA
jgi:hypothetical protein